MICILPIAAQLLSVAFGGAAAEVQQCDQCCVPDVDLYTTCYKSCTEQCLPPLTTVPPPTTKPPQALPVIEFEFSAYSVTEEHFEIDVCAVRNTGINTTSSVLLTTFDGTATGGVDYLSRTVRLPFRPGNIGSCASIRILEDGITEGVESFTVVLSLPENAQLGSLITALVDINDPV